MTICSIGCLDVLPGLQEAAPSAKPVVYSIADGLMYKVQVPEFPLLKL